MVNNNGIKYMCAESVGLYYNPQIYSELSIGNPDFIDLIERCELLSQILVDCHHQECAKPLLRCLIAYIARLQTALGESMGLAYGIERSGELMAGSDKEWIFADSELQCEYCHVLVKVLLIHNVEHHDFKILSGFIHDLVSYIAGDLKESRFQCAS
ncbi:hypothetical protein ACSFCX_12570 [Yokenella regensburgei]|uniref:hypothetical protein n=1 Tax=Yokenella regensburgei TaxID=158877 RepID=UPI0031E17770